jgi:hypothetical protein
MRLDPASDIRRGRPQGLWFHYDRDANDESSSAGDSQPMPPVARLTLAPRARPTQVARPSVLFVCLLLSFDRHLIANPTLLTNILLQTLYY